MESLDCKMDSGNRHPRMPTQLGRAAAWVNNMWKVLKREMFWKRPPMVSAVAVA